jgi:hypothetical protein
VEINGLVARIGGKYFAPLRTLARDRIGWNKNPSGSVYTLCVSDDETDARLASAAAAILGRRGGKVKSEAKTKAARKNAKKGGRPKKAKPE